MRVVFLTRFQKWAVVQFGVVVSLTHERPELTIGTLVGEIRFDQPIGAPF